MTARRARRTTRRDIVAWTNLKSAVIQACRRRQDSQAHRDALLADLGKVPETDWPWWQAYFEGVRV